MTRPCGGMSHARIGGGRRPPRCRGERPVLPCPIGRRLSGFVSVWARSIFSSSCVVVRAWCLVSAALLRAAARGGRARCVRFEVRRACACCCPVAAADAAAVRAQRLSRCLARRPGAVRAWRLRARARWGNKRPGGRPRRGRFWNYRKHAFHASNSYVGESGCGLRVFFRSPGSSQAGQATH